MRKKRLFVDKTLNVILENKTIYEKILEDIGRVYEHYLISININPEQSSLNTLCLYML